MSIPRITWLCAASLAISGLLAGCGGPSLEEQENTPPSASAAQRLKPSGFVPGVWGYAWTQQTTGTFVADPNWSGNSASGEGYPTDLPPTVIQIATGRYTVSWPQIGYTLGVNATNIGNVQVTAVDGSSNWCIAFPSIGTDGAGGDLHVAVNCFNSAGAPVDSQFNVSYYRRDDTIGAQTAYVMQLNGMTNAIGQSFTENAEWQYNSTGALNSMVRTGTGAYTMTMPGQNFSGGTVEVTALGGGGVQVTNCKVGSWSVSGANLIVNVRCFAPNGAPANSQFSVKAAKRWPEGGQQYFYVRANNPTATDYTPTLSTQQGWMNAFLGDGEYTGPATIHRNGTGSYRVRLPLMNPYYSTVKVTAYGTTSGHCKVLDWYYGPGEETDVEVRCFTAAGSPANMQFTLTYTGLYMLG
jgi:hypothetical protein